jgi:hypothetical protein
MMMMIAAAAWNRKAGRTLLTDIITGLVFPVACNNCTSSSRSADQIGNRSPHSLPALSPEKRIRLLSVVAHTHTASHNPLNGIAAAACNVRIPHMGDTASTSYPIHNLIMLLPLSRSGRRYEVPVTG